MFIECKGNDGFEDQLTPNVAYQVKAIGQNSFSVVNDQGKQRWYGFTHFKILKASL